MPHFSGMCTYLIRFDPDHEWPFLIAGNRDELRARPALPPGRHWDDRADVRAGKDVLAGGTWCGLNDTGVAAAILNKKQALGPAPGKRSRGEVVLDALDHADAIDGARAIGALDGDAYRPFNLILADNRDAFWIAHDGDATLQVKAIEPGVHLISHNDLDTGPRAQTHLARAMDAVPTGDFSDPAAWQGWIDLLSARAGPDAAYWETALNVDVPEMDFGTVSSALIALPCAELALGRQNGVPTAVSTGMPTGVPMGHAHGSAADGEGAAAAYGEGARADGERTVTGQAAPVFLYADGPGDRAPYQPVADD